MSQATALAVPAYTVSAAQVGFSYSIPAPGYINPADGTVVVLSNASCPGGNLTQGTCGTYSKPVADTPTSTSAAAPAFWVNVAVLSLLNYV